MPEREHFFSTERPLFLLQVLCELFFFMSHKLWHIGLAGKENLENYISNRHDGKENYCLLRYLCGTEILSAPFDIIMSVRITDLDIFPLQFWFHYHVLITDSRVVFYHISHRYLQGCFRTTRDKEPKLTIFPPPASAAILWTNVVNMEIKPLGKI